MKQQVPNFTVDAMTVRVVTDAILVPYKDKDTWESNHACLISSKGIVPESIHRRGKRNQTQTTKHFDFSDEIDKNFIESYHDLSINYVYGGLINDHFGHFLAECIHRIWGFNQAEYPKKIIFVADNCKNHEDVAYKDVFAGWQIQILQLLRVDPNDIIVVSQRTHFARIIVPTQASTLGPSTIASNKYICSLLSLAKWQNKKGLARDKIFISRSKLRPYLGIIVGQSYIENLYARSGFKIIHPQEFNICEQINFYANASEIVFVEGSAIHILEIVSKLPRAKKVLVLSRGGFAHKQLRAIESILKPRIKDFLIQPELMKLPIVLLGRDDQNKITPAYRQSGAWSPLSHFSIYIPSNNMYSVLSDQMRYIKTCLIDLILHFQDLSPRLNSRQKAKEVWLLTFFAMKIICYCGIDTIKIFTAKH